MLSIKGFSNNANKIINSALKVAEQSGHIYVGAEHLVCAICVTPGLVTRGIYLKNLTGTKDPCDILKKQIGTGEPTKLTITDFNETLVNIMERSMLFCLGMKNALVQPEHLLCAAVESKSTSVSDFLKAAGVDERGVRRDCADILPLPEGFANVDPKTGKSAPKTRNCDKYGTDLTRLAIENRLDPVVGRDEEIDRVISILARRRKNNPCLVGEPGVGKTAIAEGLAQRIASGDVPDQLIDKRLVMLDLTGIVAGTKYRGDFENRLKATVEEVAKSQNTILFIDEIHTLIGAGSAEGAVDAANILKPSLARGEIQLLGATTISEYAKHIEKDAALERRLVKVAVEEPSDEVTKTIIETLRSRYEQHHGVKITEEAVDAAVAMSRRYINDRKLPDKAIDLIDEACSKNNAIGKKHVLADDIARVVGLWTGIPTQKLGLEESEKLRQLEDSLRQRVIGQDEAIAAVAKSLRRARTGLKDPARPAGCFIFCGASGVGKTEVCRALALEMFGDEKALVRIDMSELSEQNAVSKLIGSPPGYVGYGEGGRLTDRVRNKPYSVVLFDEAEKASPEVCALLLQIMEEGELSDSEGRLIDFKNCIIVLTTNVGAGIIAKNTKPLGFYDGEPGDANATLVKKQLEGVFSLELLNRIDDIVVFNLLGEPELQKICNIALEELAQRAAIAGVELEYSDDVAQYIAKTCFEKSQSAREIKRQVTKLIADPLSDRIVANEVAPEDRVFVSSTGDGVALDLSAVNSVKGAF